MDLQNLTPEQEAKIRRQFNIPEGADLTILEMERHVPFTMWGWDDERIEKTTPEHIEALLTQRRAGLVRLEETVDNERREVLKLELILERCRVLHGE